MVGAMLTACCFYASIHLAFASSHSGGFPMTRHTFSTFSLLLLCTAMITANACGRDDFQRTECVSSAECRGPGKMCIQGECVTEPAGADMGRDADDGNQDDGIETDLDTPVCRVDGDCPSLPPQDSCAQSVCRSNRCAVIRPNCPDGTVLDPEQCACVPDGQPECVTRADCKAGYLCLDQVCSPCSDDSECAANERCGRAAGNPDNVCLPRAQCLLDRDCKGDEICLGGRCTDSPECSPMKPCRAGFECIGQRCFEQVCRGPEDCPADQVCDAGVCKVPDTGDRVMLYRHAGQARGLSWGTPSPSMPSPWTARAMASPHCFSGLRATPRWSASWGKMPWRRP